VTPHDRLRWGVLGAASIAMRQVIPALQRARRAELVAIASRDAERARRAAAGIARAVPGYDALVDDPDIDAIYIPLPNHLHIPWTLRARAAGKHVLCEKPLALTAAEAATLGAANDRIRVMEAFMYRSHPQWRTVHDMVRNGAVGELRAVQTVFTYDNRDPHNIRNIAAMGGGGLLDIGCYGVSVARWLFDAEPSAVHAAMELEPESGVDRLAVAALAFGSGVATVICGTRVERQQRVVITGSAGSIEVPVPFNPPRDVPAVLLVTRNGHADAVAIDAADQYVDMVEAFTASVLDGAPLPVTLDDSLGNMAVLDEIRARAVTA
jgi:predicted dehydrogenase